MKAAKENRMKCQNCNSTKIKTRKNYSHGRKSKPSKTRVCAECGSYIRLETPNKRRRRR